MAIPAEYGLVKYFTATLTGGSTDPVEIKYTLPGGLPTVSADLASQMQGQGAAVFVNNTSDVEVTVDIYTTIKIYDNDFKVFLGSFAVASGQDGGMALGYGLIKRGFEVVVTPAAAPSADADVTVAIVPTNG